MNMTTSSTKMAASKAKKSADQSRSFVRPVNTKESLNKTKVSSKNNKSTVTIYNEGMSFCANCENMNKGNMVNCHSCLRWFHHQCQSMDHSSFLFFHEHSQIAYVCQECRILLKGYFLNRVNEIEEECLARVNQVEEDIASFDDKLNDVKKLCKFKENLEFQEAVNSQIEKLMKNIKSDLVTMENNFDKFSGDIKANNQSYNSRKKRIVIFGMPNTNNDPDTVQLLLEELELGRMNIKKIFRINSKTNNESIAPPLNVEFTSMDDKWKILHKDIRAKIKTMSSSSPFHGFPISIAPDRSFRERQKYHLLRNEMDRRNINLMNDGIDNEIWIIRKMRLEKVEVEQNE